MSKRTKKKITFIQSIKGRVIRSHKASLMSLRNLRMSKKSKRKSLMIKSAEENNRYRTMITKDQIWISDFYVDFFYILTISINRLNFINLGQFSFDNFSFQLITKVMPNLKIEQSRFDELMGEKHSFETLDKLGFEFGIEI